MIWTVTLPLLTSGLVNVLNAAQKADIVYWHNLARAEIAQAGLCANMLQIKWDDTIGEVAGQYTQACASNGVLAGHNANRNTMYTNIATPTEEAAIGCSVGGYCLGENWAAGGGSCGNGGLCAQAGNCGGAGQPLCDGCGANNYCTMKSGIYDRWYVGEKSGADCKTYSAGGGHCTQVTWTDSFLVGCGWANCPGSPYGTYLTCNYGPAGNYNADVQLHGSCQTGPACSKCPANRPYCTTGALGGLCTATPPAGGPPTAAPTPQPTTLRPTFATGTPTTRPPTLAPTVAKCPALSSPPNAVTASCGISDVGTQCSFTCLQGYTGSNSGTRNCLSTGQWDSSPLVCTPKPCPDLVTPANSDPVPSTQSCTAKVQGGYCSFQCQLGFSPSDVVTRTCSNGAWTGSDLVCSQLECPALNAPAGAVTVAACIGKTQGQTCVFACQANFLLAGDATRTCENGVWSGTALTCTAPATCPALQSPGGAVVSSCTGKTNGQTCTMACLSGFSSNGRETRTCNVVGGVGSWSGTDLECTPKACPGLVSPPGAVVASCPASADASVQIGDTCTFQCLTGYNDNGFTTRTCIDGGASSSSGVWSDSALVCTPKVCSTLEVPAGATGTACANYTEGNACTFACKGGFNAVGSTSRICTDGQWSGLTLQCNEASLSGYKYTASDWGVCNATCGDGFRNRTVRCLDSSNNEVAFNLCQDLHEVDSKQRCNLGPCSTHQWRAGDWDTCSTGCGTGVQTREVDCISTTYGYTAVAADSACSGAKPDTTMLCNTQPCTASKPHWFATTSWSECSKSCGGGQQMRSWACHDSQENTQPDSNCTGSGLPKPAGVRDCNVDACTDLGFRACAWEACTTPCMGGGNDLNFMTGQQQRQVYCRDGLNGPIYDPQLCLDKGMSQPAALTVGCNVNLPCDQGCTNPPCAYWMTSLWSPCVASTSTGTAGTRTRTCHCHAGDGSNLPDASCPPSLKPALTQPCDIRTCPEDTPKLGGASPISLGFAFVFATLAALLLTPQ